MSTVLERKMRIPPHRQRGYQPPTLAEDVTIPKHRTELKFNPKRDFNTQFANAREKEQIGLWLKPQDEFRLTMDKVEEYFVHKIVHENYQLEKTSVCGPQICQTKPVESKWTDSTKLYVKTAGYTGDFRNPKSQQGFGRSPYGGFYTNFK
ncbi:unnamed protein product [Amoebophrya sp. A120]|nr:unnamed protein product [Amoebophrya sp. A120]|eukprot:GSA120T00021762001.1